MRNGCHCSILFMLSALALPAAGVQITVAPDTVLIVQGNGVQKLNFDFLVRHAEADPLVLLSGA